VHNHRASFDTLACASALRKRIEAVLQHQLSSS
jgi:hypothetical protein